MQRFVRHPGVVLLFLALGPSCSALRRVTFQPPTVDLVAVEVTGIGLTGGSLNLVLDVYNPNRYDLHTTRLALSLDLEETHFGDAELQRAVALPAEAHASVGIPVTFTWEGVGAGARALLSRGSVRYALDGRIVADTPVGSRGVDLRTGGVVTVRDLMR